MLAVQLSVTKCGATLHIAVVGEVDTAESDKVLDAVMIALRDRACARVMLDLSGVTFMDCSGLSALVRIRGEAEQYHSHFKIVCASPSVRRLLALTDLDGAMPIF